MTTPAPPASTLGRRAFLGGALATAATLGLTACGSSQDSPDGSGGVGAGFPVEVKHRFGTTTVPERPKRVVSAGSCTQDYLLALGCVPVAVTEWYGDKPDASWPWAHEALDGAHPTVLSASDGFQFEKIASLRPDLIVATNDGMKATDYAKLSALAPTLAQSGDYDNYYVPWDVQALAIGTALGLRDRAQRLIDGIHDKFDAAAGRHPEFAGTKAIFLQNAVYDGSVIAYQDGLSTQFLTDLGFVVPDGLEKYAKDAQAFIPVERLDVLDSADVLIWATEKPSDEAALHKVPGFDRLDAVRAGRSVYTGGTLSGAIYFTSPLSLPYVLDHLVPQLAKVLA